MQNEFLLLNDYTDEESCATSICISPQLLGDLIDIKQSGANTRKIYSPSVNNNSRVYTYNFKTKCVELDEILAIEHIVGEFDQYSVRTYKTTPTVLTNYDRVATNTHRMNPSPKFISCSKLSNHSSLLLQVEGYNNISNVEDVVMVASDETGEMEIPMTYDVGSFIGNWVGNGTIRTRDGSKYVELNVSSEYYDTMDGVIRECFPTSFEVTDITESKGEYKFKIYDHLLANWLETSHDIMDRKQLPSAYYSAPDEFIRGLFMGVIMSASRISINNNKNVLYCTLASQSKCLTQQWIELLSLYMSVPANLSMFKLPNDKHLYIANIRVTDAVYEALDLYGVTEVQKKYIPKSSISRLHGFDDVVTIMRPGVEKLKDKVTETYRLRLKNNDNIIGLNGIIHKCEVGFRL